MISRRTLWIAVCFPIAGIAAGLLFAMPAWLPEFAIDSVLIVASIPWGGLHNDPPYIAFILWAGFLVGSVIATVVVLTNGVFRKGLARRRPPSNLRL
jgi:hypothetical protein